jgi:hypothetical protein
MRAWAREESEQWLRRMGEQLGSAAESFAGESQIASSISCWGSTVIGEG